MLRQHSGVGKDQLVEDRNSCLVDKLSYYVELGARERELLARMEKEERHRSRGDVVAHAGQPLSEILVVKDGWLHTATTLPDGRRQLLRLHFPGDVIGLPEMPLAVAPHDVQAVTDCTLCPFPKAEMGEVFRGSSQLTALFFSLAMIDQLVLLDRIRVLGRMSARERIAHFLLEIQSRLRIVQPRMAATFPLPLTQGEIADALGLTNVYVSKSMSRLREDGLISLANGGITLENEEALREMCDFEDRYRRMDGDWMPRG